MGLCSSSSAARAADPAGGNGAGNKDEGRKGGGGSGGRGIVACGKRTDFGYEKDFEARYTLGKLLGHGQFGYTFAAVDRRSGERLAVKRIDKNKMVLPVAVEDVKREVKILKALQGHENLVHFYNAFEDDNYVYIVMELCEGGELLDRILAKVNLFSAIAIVCESQNTIANEVDWKIPSQTRKTLENAIAITFSVPRI